jgi:ketosteroid isomerase-like protein
MKKILFLLMLLVVAGACKRDKVGQVSILDPAALSKEVDKVEMVLERYVIASEKQDLDLIHNIWAPDTNIMVIGTEGTERLIGWSEIQDAFRVQFNSIQQPYLSVHDQVIGINPTGTTAWFSEVLNYSFIRDEKPVRLEGVRFTGVMERRDSVWLIVQSHLSLPAATE